MIYVRSAQSKYGTHVGARGNEASFSLFSAAFLTLSQGHKTHTHTHTHTHTQTHTMPVKTAGGPSVPHTEAVTSWTGENVNRPSGAQFKKNAAPLRKTNIFFSFT